MRKAVSATSHPTTALAPRAGRNTDFKNARFCRARGIPGRRDIVEAHQELEVVLSGHRTYTGREGRVAGSGRCAHIRSMRLPLLAPPLFAALLGLAGATAAQINPSLPPVTSIGSQAPSMPAPAPSVPPGGTSAGARYPNTESLSRDRIQSQGYKVQRLEPRNDGSWKAETRRDAVPTRPRGVPTKVTILPDGRMLEEYN